MHNCKCNHSDNFLPGLIFGALVGGLLGVLFAPEAGDKTRIKIKNKGEKVLQETKVAAKKYKKQAIDPQIKVLKKEIKKKATELEKSANKLMK